MMISEPFVGEPVQVTREMSDEEAYRARQEQRRREFEERCDSQKGRSDMPKEESRTKEGDTRQQVCPATRARKATTYLIKLD